MIWLTLFSILASLGVIFFNVQPVAVQIFVFALSASLFLTTLLKDMPKPEKIKTWLQQRSLLILSLIILCVVNVLAKKYDHVFDLSKSKIYALRSETLEWIGKIEEPTEIIIFLKRDDKTVAYAEWLQKQINTITSKVHISIKNINQEIALTQKYDIHQTGEVVLISGDHTNSRWVKAPNFQEKNLIQGIARLVTKTSSTLCFLTGHGEADLEDTTPEGLNRLKQLLIGLGYQTISVSFETHTLFQLEKECGLLAILNPKTNFQDTEIFRNILQSPLPLIVTYENGFSPNIRQELQKIGLTFSHDLLIDMNNMKLKKPLTDIFWIPNEASSFFDHFTTGLYAPQAEAIFIKSQTNSWVPFLTIPSSQNIQLLDDKTEKGPFILGVQKIDGSKIILTTGRSFLSSTLDFGENQKFFLNIVHNFLKEPFVDISKSFEDSEKRLILSENEIFWIKNFCFYIFPLLLTGICFGVWYRRWKIP